MKNKIAYQVGGLLYTPASNKSVSKKIINDEFSNLTSIAFCLEDSIDDRSLDDAEKQLLKTLKALFDSKQNMPMIFIRVSFYDSI